MITLHFDPQNSQVKKDCSRDRSHRKHGPQPTKSQATV